MKDKTKREIISKSCAARSYLYMNGFLSESEMNKVHQRIRKYQDKHRIGITDEQIFNVEFKYNGD